ncbi:MAG: cell division protein FtsQ/DivIB, partial [Eubacterium sp.]
MKKSQKKKTQKPQRKTVDSNRKNLDDLGLEPPKIYRNNQKPAYSRDNSPSTPKKASRNVSAEQNLTRAEKRQKDNKKRKKRNTLRKVIVWLVVIVAFVAVGTVLSLTVFFQIDTINVTGNTIYTKDEILAQCTIDKGENLFLSDTETAKEMLEQNLPYIYNAE